jgi:hypothetical protein
MVVRANKALLLKVATSPVTTIVGMSESVAVLTSVMMSMAV